MCREVINSAFAMLFAGAMFVSCGNDEVKRASDLFTQAQEAFSSGNYELSSQLLDSIDSSCKTAIEVRKEAMHLRPQVIEKKSLVLLETTDSLLARQTIVVDSLMSHLRLVKNPVENYYIYSDIKNTDASSEQGLHARLSTDGQFYLISAAPCGSLSESVSVSCNGVSASTAVVSYDGERNDRAGALEIITFIQAECDTVGRFIKENSDNSIMLSFNGKKTKTGELKSVQREAIATVYRAGEAIRRSKQLSIQKAKHEKQLQVARSQIARTFNVE